MVVSDPDLETTEGHCRQRGVIGLQDPRCEFCARFRRKRVNQAVAVTEGAESYVFVHTYPVSLAGFGERAVIQTSPSLHPPSTRQLPDPSGGQRKEQLPKSPIFSSVHSKYSGTFQRFRFVSL